MKKVFQNLHLFIGLTAGLVIFTVATTGCLVAFEEELRGYFQSELLEVKVIDGSRIPLSEIQLIAEKAYPEEGVKAIVLKNERSASVQVLMKSRDVVYINPYSGEVLGSGNKRNDVFGKILRLHRNLLLDDAGEWVTGISALLFLFMIISGIIIWWPSSRRNRKEKFTLKLKVHPVKRNYDLHSVLGFYASWLILFTVLTALIFSFEWAEKSMFALTGSKKERRMEVPSVAENGNQLVALETMLNVAKAKFTNSSNAIVNFPEGDKGSYRINLRYENSGFFNRQEQLFFDQYTGALLQEKKFSDNTFGTKLRMSNERIHTGQSFGLIGRWIVFFAALIVASLPITGFLIWWNKRKANG
ncbi:MAG: PepSY-associated TM helix domain-containing protein [Crocinitomicaceae bacterium]